MSFLIFYSFPSKASHIPVYMGLAVVHTYVLVMSYSLKSSYISLLLLDSMVGTLCTGTVPKNTVMSVIVSTLMQVNSRCSLNVSEWLVRWLLMERQLFAEEGT